uniref:YWTD domain protein n=1 Tax=Musca domestica TaxID=7370 RepID=T1PDX9_MUSDO
MALEFLMREIVNVFNKQKQVAKLGEQNGNRKISTSSSNKESPQKQGRDLEKTAKAAENAKEGMQKHVDKALMGSREDIKTTPQPVVTPPLATAATAVDATHPNHAPSEITKTTETTPPTCHKTSNGLKPHKEESSAQHHLNRINQLQRETENQFNHIRTLTNLSNTSDYNLLPLDTSSIRFNASIFDYPSSSTTAVPAFTTQPPTFPALDLELLKKQSPIGEAVVNNLREIDVKLMELHKRKMYIEEMILKLQKDKMDTDLLTIKLQNEKFILLNTAMTANVTTSAAPEKCKKLFESINLKNIKTETVDITDDEQQQPSPPLLAKSKSHEEVANISSRLGEERQRTTSESSSHNPGGAKAIDSNPKDDITTSSSSSSTARHKSPAARRKSTTEKSKRKNSSDSIHVGETFKRLCRQAQKASSENREVSSSGNKNNDNSRPTTPAEEPRKKSNKNSRKNSEGKSGRVRKHKSENKKQKQETETQNGATEVNIGTPSDTPKASTSSTLSPVQESTPAQRSPSPPPPHTTSSLAPSPRPASSLSNASHDTIATATTNIPPPTGDCDNFQKYKNMPCRLLENLQSPIAQIRIYQNSILASTEDGKIFMFNASTLELVNTFNKHTEAITQMYLCEDKGYLFTTSLDGYMKKSLLENLSSGTQSVYLKEPLQTLDIQWDTAFTGSRWGNIYTTNISANVRSAALLCSTESSILTIKAAKEGARKVLIVSSKGNLIHVRDASSGLLLRTFDVPDCINIYSILLNDGLLYCGTQKKEIRKYDFVSGAPVGSITCGNGAVSMLMFRNKYMFVGCYDGFIYVIDKETGRQITRLTGSGKMILTLEIVGDKVITSAKDASMKIINIPTFCLTDSL